MHLIGKLQTNKVKYAVKIFDYIHSLDSEKLAKKISDEQQKQDVKPKIFIQINLGKESQKSGIMKEHLVEFYNYSKSLGLDIIGTMCIPPFDEDSSIYFPQMNELNRKINLDEISMGMSSDYLNAIEFKSTFLRIGSNIFGQRGWAILIFVFLLMSFNKIRKSFFWSAIHPAVGLYFFVKWIKIALPAPILVFFVLYLF